MKNLFVRTICALTLTIASGYADNINTLTKACNSGNADACFSLGIKYYNGNGVKKDQNKAEQLYKQACKGGISEACIAVNFGK
ncbi:MAG: sel1 repeat family protein [Sulfuricurvum sp.]|nr:sel1 repeat family protein [Sulfuricurvum sp.]MDP3022759.1 sel1 repeat family protein [Sulfuricurvum sp.]